ncbi:PREDICTED: uncharacterized protein LOC107193252, partial [Dufourea novaeangliae]
DRLGFPHPEVPTSNGTINDGYAHTSIPTICQPNGHSDHGSSSGVSSFGDPERPLHSTIIPPPVIFKSSIKQRFSAERIKSSPPPATTPEKPCSSHGVPIFALHDGGAFYVPFTVEASLLRPHLNFIPDTGPDTVLHPVTISVNFNQSSPPAWSNHHSPMHQQT